MGKNQPPATLEPCIDQLFTAAQRIQDALDEASPSVEQLGEAFTEIITSSRQLSDLATATADNDGGNPDEMQQHCGSIEKQAGNAIMGFKFFDRLSQRLGHINASLLAIAELLEHTGPQPTQQDWENLVIKIVETLCLDDDKASVATLLDHKMDAHKVSGQLDDNEIELF
jgi:hypothetical protein